MVSNSFCPCVRAPYPATLVQGDDNLSVCGDKLCPRHGLRRGKVYGRTCCRGHLAKLGSVVGVVRLPKVPMSRGRTMAITDKIIVPRRL